MISTRIYLADLAHNYSVSDRSLPVPLSLGYHKAYADTVLGDSVDITLFKHPERFLAAIGEATPDIVGFANYGWNENLNRAIGGYVRARCPDALIVVGGPNIDPDPLRREDYLRSTTTMSEDDLFDLRKMHFLVDFCWNIEVYKPLLRVAQAYRFNPVDVLIGVLEAAEKGSAPEVAALFARFDAMSREEWFDSAEAIEAHFAVPAQFQRLIDQEFEKLNILFSIVLLRETKPAFDALVESVIDALGAVPEEMLRAGADHTFSLFPSLAEEHLPEAIELPENYLSFDPEIGPDDFVRSAVRRRFTLAEPPARQDVRGILDISHNQTLSKILNTQGIALRDMKLSMQVAA